MDKPLILHVITDTGVGGAEARLALFLEHRNRERADHEVVTLKSPGKLASRISETGVRVSSLEMHSAVDFASAARRFAQIVEERRPSVVQSYLFHANTLARPIARLRSVPLVVSGYASTDPRMSPGRRVADVVTARFAHLHFANSRAVAEAVMRRIGVSQKKMRVVYPGRPDPLAGADIEKVVEKRRLRTPPLVLAVGRLHEAKGHRVLIEALQGVRGDWEAVIVGDGPLRSPLEKLASELGVADRVRFVGEIEDPSPFYSEASLFALPSLWEGMPGALIEAMLWRLPVVASSVGGVPEAIRHRESGLLFSPEDVDTLATLIEYLLEDREYAERLAGCARDRALEAFRIETMVENWESMYLDALKEKG